MQAVENAVKATREVLRLRAELAAACEALEGSWVAMMAEGVPKTRVAERYHDALGDAGVERVSGDGFSSWTVRQVLDRA